MGNKLEGTVGLEDGAGKPEAYLLDPSSSVCLVCRKRWDTWLETLPDKLQRPRE